MKTTVLIGRILYSLIFILSGFHHFSQEAIKYGESQGTPMAVVAVPLAGVMAIVGGLSILTGFKTKFGAILIILFLIPVTLIMHNFWGITDPMMRQMQMAMFMKNLSMLGGAFIIYYHGAGPLSLDQKTKKANPV